MKLSLSLLCLALIPAAPVSPVCPDGPAGVAGAVDEETPEERALREGFASAGIQLDLTAGTVAIPVAVEVRDDLLEYLLTLPHGDAHETMFLAGVGVRSSEEAMVWAQTLNAAILALGLEAGKNARWVQKDPAPSEEEMKAGISPYDVMPPEGDALYLYAAWKQGEETYLYRIEDLIRDLDRQRTMRRHQWVFLGSRMVERANGETSFAAGVEGNLINVSFFPEGNTLLTGSLPECLNQTTWLPNAWLLPHRGETVLFVFSRERLDALPSSLEDNVPSVRED